MLIKNKVNDMSFNKNAAGKKLGSARSAKGVSTLIAAVIIVAFTVAIAVIVTGSLTSVIKSQTTATETASKCPGAAIDIVATSATASGFQVTITNVGKYTLSNFTVTATTVGNTIFQNSTAGAALSLASGATGTITFGSPPAGTGLNTTVGCPLSKLRVSAVSCQGIWTDIDNTTKSIC